MTITGHCNEIRQLEIIKSTKQHVHLFSMGLIRAKSSKCIASVIQYSWESPADLGLLAAFSYIRGKQSLQIVLYYTYMTVIPWGTCFYCSFGLVSVVFICCCNLCFYFLANMLVQSVWWWYDDDGLCVLSTHLSYYYVTFIDILLCVANKFDLIWFDIWAVQQLKVEKLFTISRPHTGHHHRRAKVSASTISILGLSLTKQQLCSSPQ